MVSSVRRGDLLLLSNGSILEALFNAHRVSVRLTPLAIKALLLMTN